MKNEDEGDNEEDVIDTVGDFVHRRSCSPPWPRALSRVLLISVLACAFAASSQGTPPAKKNVFGFDLQQANAQYLVFASE